MRNNSFRTPATGRSNVFRNSRFGGNQRPKRQGAYINPDKFVNKASLPQEQEVFVPTHQFADFNFSQALKRNVQEHGYVTPTPIQDGSIEAALEGKDLIGLANTGTGKTAAFVLPIIERLMKLQGTALIIAPTR